MNREGRAGVRTFVLLGWPVEHSLSPAIYRAAFRALELEAVYGALPVRENEVASTMRAVARAGGGNVTVPHKREAAAVLDRPSAAVRRTGACNCFWMEEETLAGDNTDVGGFRLALEGWRAVSLPPSRVLLLGAGGAARAVLAALLDEGAERVDVLNRTTERARRMVGEVTAAGEAGEGAARAASGEEEVRERGYDLVVNATSLGMSPGDPLPLDLRTVDAAAAFDLVYGSDGPGGTAWVRHASELGVPATDGLEMLVRQAALSVRRWTGRLPPVEEMRRAAREVLSRRAR